VLVARFRCSGPGILMCSNDRIASRAVTEVADAITVEVVGGAGGGRLRLRLRLMLGWCSLLGRME
jgi:hypothetical protein